MQDVGSRENMKRFEEGHNPNVEYRLSKLLDTVSALEIGLHSGVSDFTIGIHQFAEAIRPTVDSPGWRASVIQLDGSDTAIKRGLIRIATRPIRSNHFPSFRMVPSKINPLQGVP